MGIEELSAALTLAKTAISAFKEARNLIPGGPQRQQIEDALDNAEKAFVIAEAQVADELRYPICRKHWPPEIMLLIRSTEDSEIFQCPKCQAIIGDD